MCVCLLRSGCESLAESVEKILYWFRLHLRNENVSYIPILLLYWSINFTTALLILNTEQYMHSFEEQKHALYQHAKVQLLLVRFAGTLRITDNLLFMCSEIPPQRACRSCVGGNSCCRCRWLGTPACASFAASSCAMLSTTTSRSVCHSVPRAVD